MQLICSLKTILLLWQGGRSLLGLVTDLSLPQRAFFGEPLGHMELNTFFLNKEPSRSPDPATCSHSAAGKPSSPREPEGRDEHFVWKKEKNSTEHFLRACLPPSLKSPLCSHKLWVS